MRVIKLMADFSCFPLWGTSPERLGDFHPRELGISDELVRELMEWAKAYDETFNDDYPPDSGFESESAKLAFQERGAVLAERLQHEVGDEYKVVYRPPA